MVHLTDRMIIMEAVCRQCGERYFSCRFYGKINLEISWGLQGEKKANQITS